MQDRPECRGLRARARQARLGFVVLVLAAVVGLASTAHAETGQAPKPGQVIAMIGAGDVGSTLGTLWAAAGYHVIFATRHPDQLDEVVAAAGHGAEASAVGPAIQQADIVALAVPYKAEPAIARQYGSALKGRILVDADNAFSGRDGEVATQAEQMGEALYSAKLFSGTRFIRAFNMISASRYPAPGNLDATNFDVVYTTNDDSVRSVAEDLIRATGGTPVYKGDLANAPEY
ncbi:NAD(P)-binding domain-containing protein [Salinisphaera sp. SPP-AMP-43]|uniref:NADPH-dependent F420 reductase n=1 Tax=Salinisphaera sp. SPP-AMP-43 TaxID=3121288 RepID=UPI003C6DE20A